MVKKIFFYFAILYSTLSFSQVDSLKLTINYLPNKQYTFNNNISNSTEIEFSGKQELIDSLKLMGVQTQINQTTKDKSKLILTTYGLNKDNIFNIILKVDETNIPFLEDFSMEGYCKKNSLPIFTKIKASKIDSLTKKQLTESFQEVLKNIKFPDQNLKIGDSFTMETPMNIPIGNKGTIELEAKSKYTLKQITNNNAFFDYNIDLTIKNNAANSIQIKGTGNGYGQMTYSIQNQFISNQNGTTNLNFKMNMDTDNNLILNLNMVMKVSQDITIN